MQKEKQPQIPHTGTNSSICNCNSELAQHHTEYCINNIQDAGHDLEMSFPEGDGNPPSGKATLTV